MKKLYISVANVFACLSVVLLHANTVFWTHPTGRLWITSNFIETFFYWAVPVFYMISGVTLIDYRERYSTSVFLKKRAVKTLIPFVFWSFFACVFNIVVLNKPMDWNVLHILDNIINTRYLSIYWFFPALFALYLSIPVLGAVQNKGEVFQYAIFCGVVTVYILPLVFALFGIPYNSALKLPIASGALTYAMTGYCIEKEKLTPKQRGIIYLFGIIGFLLHFFGTIVASEGHQEVVRTFKGYYNIPCYMQSVAVFVLFKYFPYEKFFSHLKCDVEKLFYQYSSLTFGIYLIHRFLLITIPMKFDVNIASIVWRVGGGIGVFLFSGLIVAMIKKIPVLSKIVP